MIDARTPNGLAVTLLPESAADDTTVVQSLVTMINAVYATSEQGLWRDGADRTSAEELPGLIRAGEIAVARSGDRVVGSVRLQRLDDTTAEFGMLVAEPTMRGVGVGRELVAFVERWARAEGLTAVQLEVLSPVSWVHPAKEFLRGWYTRLGFRVHRIGTFRDDYPVLAPLLATECVYTVYRKPVA